MTTGAAITLFDSPAPANPPAGYETLYFNGGLAYLLNSSGVSTLLTGLTAVNNTDGTITVSIAGSTATVSRAAITGGISVPAGSDVATVLTNANLTGPVTSVGNATSIPGPVPIGSLGNMSADTVLGNNTGSPAAPVQMTVAQTSVLLNIFGWIDVTQQPTPVLTSNSGTTNVSNINTILAAAPADSVIYFPPTATQYQMNGAWNALTKDFSFVGVYGHSNIAWVTTGLSTGALITCSTSGFYTSFYGLSFQTFVSMTGTNYVIDTKANVNVVFQDCQFNGGATTAFANCINFSDATNGGNGAVVRHCQFQAWSGTAINVAGTKASPFFQDIEMIGNGLSVGNSAVGIACPNGGAILMVDCGIILCNINVNINVSGVNVASVFAVNCFFDQGVTNSLAIVGTSGPVVRCHFASCWFTSAAGAGSSGSGCVSITGTNIAQGVEFHNCWVVNVSGATGTTNGFLITGAQDFEIEGCQIAGWTNGIQITPSTAGTCQPTIVANTIGPLGQAAGNGTGILLNAGAVTYGAIQITDNNLTGNTTAPLTDNSTQATTGQKNISNNTGLPVTRNTTSNLSSFTITTTAVLVASLSVPAVSLRAGQVFKVKVYGTMTAAAATVTATIHFGTALTTSDTLIGTVAPVTTATASELVWEFTVIARSATSLMATGYNLIFGIAPATTNTVAITAPAAVTVANSANSALTCFLVASAGTLTVVNAEIECLQQ